MRREKRPPLFLKNIYLRSFRNYEEAAAEFSPGLNVIAGDNAQGKTNLLEAISLVSTGRSFRTQHLSELIQEGSSFFFIEAEIEKDGVSQTVQISFDGQNKKLQLNATTFSTFHPLLGTLPSVLSVPEDSDLIAGSPNLRRRFLNLHLAQCDPLYVHHLSRYWRAMKQRNCLLKSKSTETLDCWEEEMALSAAYLSAVRHQLLEEIGPPLGQESQRLSGDAEKVELRFHPAFQAGTYLQQLRKARSREMDLGQTQNGPHRDDLSFWIGQKPARTFASEGQKKTAVAALRLAEWRRLKERINASPLLAIDDFGWPLDQTRQKLLFASLLTMGQTFITTPESIDGGRSIRVEKGKINLGA